jgi:hypothetical protein
MKSLAIPVIAALLSATTAHAASSFDDVAVDVFARDAYSMLYTLDGASIDRQVGEARSLFAIDTEGRLAVVNAISTQGDCLDTAKD